MSSSASYAAPMRRVVTPELMDDPGVDRAALDHSLRYIRGVNRLLGGRAALLRALDRWRDPLRAGGLRLLDVATGSADLPLAVLEWARRHGIDARVVAIDTHATTLDLAREHVAQHPGAADRIELVLADAFDLPDRFSAGSFDVVHAGLFIHHLPELRALTMLRIMDRLSRQGLVWNDLARTRIGYAAIHAMTLGQPRIIRHDARVSVRAGFTRAEALEMTRRVGWFQPEYRWNLFTHRFTVTSWRPAR